MKTTIVYDGEDIINATDYEKKADYIIDELDKRIFDGLDSIADQMIKRDDEGNIVDFSLVKFNKNQIRPLLSPTKITIELNLLLRKYRPLNLVEAQSIEPDDYINAFTHYCRVISHISDYLMSYVPSKQTFCAFCNITTDIYNELLQNQVFTQVFKSFEDAFVDNNFVVAQAGIVDSKSTMAKLQTKDAGHNLIKNPEAVIINNYNKTDKALVIDNIKKFDNLIANNK